MTPVALKQRMALVKINRMEREANRSDRGKPKNVNFQRPQIREESRFASSHG